MRKLLGDEVHHHTQQAFTTKLKEHPLPDQHLTPRAASNNLQDGEPRHPPAAGQPLLYGASQTGQRQLVLQQLRLRR